MLAVLYSRNRLSQETSSFDSIISNVLEANATLHSTKLDLNVDNFRPFLEAVSVARELIVKASRIEGHHRIASEESPKKAYMECVQHIVLFLEESQDNKRNTRDNLLEITAKFLGNKSLIRKPSLFSDLLFTSGQCVKSIFRKKRFTTNIRQTSNTG